MTKFYSQNSNSLLQVKYEDLEDGERTAFSELLLRWSVPIGTCMSAHANTRCQTVDLYEGPLHSDTQTAAWRLGYKLSHCITSRFLYYDAGAVHGALVWIQKGDNSKPTFVISHALFGTPMGGSKL